MNTTYLDANIVVPQRNIDVSVEVSPGATHALIGPNGAGKSTVLASIAGIGPGGDISVRVGDDVEVPGKNGASWDAPAANVHLRAHERDCGYLTQNPLLFPHLTCLDNVAYGLRARHGHSRGQARTEARQMLASVGMEAYAARLPHELSGGQAARVALARALAPRPRVVLLDEPFAALDIESAHSMRELCAQLLKNTTTLLATHNVRDVRVLADSVSVIVAGRVAECGAVGDVLTSPQTHFTRRFIEAY